MIDEEKVKEILDFIESYFVDIVEPDQTVIHHINEAEWQSVKDRAYKAICQLDTEVCPACHGNGDYFFGCTTCKGTGRIRKSDTPVKVRRLTDEEIAIMVNPESNFVLMTSHPVQMNHTLDACKRIAETQLDLIRQLNPEVKFEEVGE